MSWETVELKGFFAFVRLPGTTSGEQGVLLLELLQNNRPHQELLCNFSKSRVVFGKFQQQNNFKGLEIGFEN